MSINNWSFMQKAARPAIMSIRSCPFDLVARAELAIDGCTRLTDPERAGQPYTYAEFHTEPPIALHAPWDHYDSAAGLFEALTLARIMASSPVDERDATFARLLAKHQREDGLLGLPSEPWTHTAPILEMDWSPRAALLAWTTRIMAADDADARERAERLIQALGRRVVWDEDMCWLPASIMPEGGWRDRSAPVGRMPEALTGAQLVFPLVRYGVYAANKQAMLLAHGLIRFFMERSGAFAADGAFTDHTGRYFHSNMGFVLGVLKYGIATGRDVLVDWAQTAYLHARELGTDFGFFPRALSGEERWQCDTSAIADMIEIALLLGIHKDPRFYADAEQFGRNHLLESQILDFSWVDERIDAEFSRDLWCKNHPPQGVTTDDVCERTIGGFASWSLPNDRFDPSNPRIMQRCTASGVRALYALWHTAVARPEGAVQVNLHFSRDTRWATITSSLPTEGKLEVMMKTRGVLAVRIPKGVEPGDIEVSVNFERNRREEIRGNYAWVEALQQGDLVTFRWPLTERAVVYQFRDRHFTGHWRGETMMQMEPSGVLAPLYRRPKATAVAPPRNAVGALREIDTL